MTIFTGGSDLHDGTEIGTGFFIYKIHYLCPPLSALPMSPQKSSLKWKFSQYYILLCVFIWSILNFPNHLLLGMTAFPPLNSPCFIPTAGGKASKWK